MINLPIYTYTLFIFLFICTTHVYSCGVTTHNVIANRAMKWFLSQDYPEYEILIEKHQDAYQNGAAFPDWGYSCPLGEFYSSLPNASEYAHWPPFQHTTVQYIREKYPQPWSETTEKLVAFLFGVVSHTIADVLWHDLPNTVYWTHQGFIQSMADVNFAGNYDRAHTEADVGGEFMTAYEINLGFLVDEWYLPSEDLAAIYQRANFTQVTPLIIETCNAELYAEVQAISHLPSELLYPHFAEKAPFLVDHFQDWWIGGVNDMSTWTTWCWPYVEDWIENGLNTDICLVMVNESHGWPDPTSSSRYKSRLAIADAMKEYRQHIQVKKTKTDRGVLFSVEHNTLTKNSERRVGGPACINQVGTANTLTIVTDDALSTLGKSLAVGDFNRDGIQDIVVGAPGFSLPGQPQVGAAYIVMGKPVKGHEEIIVGVGHYQNATSIFGKQEGARLGTAMGTLDFNLDGYLDLAISIPGTEAIDLKYKGEIHIFLGNESGIHNEVDIRIVADSEYTNLGEVIEAGDVDGDGHADLVLGNPFAKLYMNGTRFESGQVWIYFSSRHHKSGQVLERHHANIILHGDKDFDWFGYDVKVIENDAQGNSYILVGAPQYRDNDTSVGKLHCFDLQYVGATKHHDIPPNPLPTVWTITGTQALGNFGQSFSVGNPTGANSQDYVVVSAPTVEVLGEHWYSSNMPQAGAVYIFSIEGLAGNYTLDDITMAAQFYGDEEFARLGWSVGFSPIKNANTGANHLWISTPWRNLNLFPSDADAGASYFWQGGSSFPLGIVTSPVKVSDVCMQSSNGKSLFGFSSKLLDFNGDGLVDLAVGSPRDHTYGENAGSVTIFINIA